MTTEDSEADGSDKIWRRSNVQPEDAWRLVTEPMNQEEPRRAVAAIEEALPHISAFPVDPRRHLVLAWDRWGVEMFIEALSTIAAAGRPVPDRLIQELKDWVERADPYDDPDDPDDREPPDVWPRL